MAVAYDEKRIARLQRAYDEHLASQDAKTKAEDLTAYADRPADFIREVLGDTRLWSKPLEIIESVRVNRKTTVRGAVAMGKGHTAAELAIWWYAARRGFVIVTGSTQDQVFRNFFEYELGKLWRPRRNRLGGDLFKRALVPTDMSADMVGDERMGIVGVVSKDISHMTGSHGALILGIVDEAQDVETAAFDALFNNATGPDDRFLAIGNPSPPKIGADSFYDSHQEGSGWHRIVMPTSEHPNIVEGRTVIPGGPSQVWLDDMRKIKTAGSPWWKTFVEAEFPEKKVDALLTKADIEAMKRLFKSELRLEANGKNFIIGIDVAKGGGDRGSMAIMRGPVLEEIYAFDTVGPVETEQAIVKKLREIGARPANKPGIDDEDHRWDSPDGTECLLVIDSAPTGGGPGVIGHLRADYGYECAAFNGASRVPPSDDTERYENQRAFGYWAIRLAAQERRLALCPDKELEEELLAITYSFTKSDGVLITQKKEIRKVLRRSPDKGDALMMAWSQYQDQYTEGGTAGVNLGF